MLRRSYTLLHELIHRPVRVLWICIGLASIGVFLDGTALRLWSLHRDHQVITERIAAAEERLHKLQFKIQEAQQPEFIERAARDQFDLVKEGDLIFLFSGEEADASEKNASM